MPLTALLVDDAGVLTDPEVEDAVLALHRRGIPVAVVTNADVRRPGLDAYDAVVVSGEVGLRKPDPRIWALAAARLGVATSACVAVDDVASYVRGAVAAGCTGVVHRDAASTADELAVLFAEVRPEPPAAR